KSVAPDEIYDVDWYSIPPVALGEKINDSKLLRLKAKVIAGSANNQLQEDKHGDILHEKGIVYAPDYVINSGGVINVADELDGYDKNRVLSKVDNIYHVLSSVFEMSKEKNIPTYQAADKIAAIFHNDVIIVKEKINHPLKDIENLTTAEQVQLRKNKIMETLLDLGINISKLDAIAASGGLIRPLEGGTYEINQAMLEDLAS